MEKIFFSIMFAAFFSNAQTTFLQYMDNSSVKSNSRHFHASCAGTILIAETIDVIEIALDKEPHKARNIIISGLSVYAAGELKERIYDRMLGKGQFSKADLFFNGWGVTCGMIIKTCANDWRERRRVERQNELEYKKRILD